MQMHLNSIMIFRMIFSVAVLFPMWVAAQMNLKGKVVDSRTNEALGGATVTLLSEGKAEVTDEQGIFIFNVANSKAYEAEIRYIGYAKQRVMLMPGEEHIVTMQEFVTLTDAVTVQATRAGSQTPTTYSEVGKKIIRKQNFGQDLPVLLNWSPSVVTTSDAGNGVGYTGINIRGSDATRINVTLNGIPYNDSESQGVFWVDVPDIASSTQSIQIQRGVGSSTNGPGAFGATINLQTNTLNSEAYGEWISSAGSFNTWRNTLSLGTGLINNHWAIDGRISKIKSDGFIDRGSSDLTSYYFSAGYYTGKTMLKAIAFGGHEITYQSWYGVPESRLKNNGEAMLITAANEGWNELQTQNLLNSNSRTFNAYLYENQVDDYKQDHYQLHTSHKFSPALTGNVSLHYTYGRGFYEEYRYEDTFSNYGLSPVVIGDSTITGTDIIRKRWLDNDFYGITFSLHHEANQLNTIFGGALNQYDGRHFGEIIWAEVSTVPKGYRYYGSEASKLDFTMYNKTNYQLTDRVNAYIDLQLRTIDYHTIGNDNRQNEFDVDVQYTFFNPKVGAVYDLQSGNQLYASFAIANREPVRRDFVDNPTDNQPRAERLSNLEVGLRKNSANHSFNLNFYWMQYKNQLVVTGALNDVGAPIRVNVDDSNRAGIELDGIIKISNKVTWNANLTLSRNRINEFTEVLYDYGINFDDFIVITNTYKNTPISFSPEIIGGSILSYSLFPSMELALLTKYVGEQFLDNTGNENRKIDGFLTNDFRLGYTLKPKKLDEISIHVLVNNVFNVDYESNGYTYGYFGGGQEYRENYYYPQAGINFMAMVSVRF